MADKKFGQKRVCPHCEKKFYDLNKKSPFNCPCGEKEIVIEDDDTSFLQNTPIIQQPNNVAQDPEEKDNDQATEASSNEDDSTNTSEQG